MTRFSSNNTSNANVYFVSLGEFGAIKVGWAVLLPFNMIVGPSVCLHKYLAVFPKLLLLLLPSPLPFNVTIVPSNIAWSRPALAIYPFEVQHGCTIDEAGVVIGVVAVNAVT